LNLLFREMVIHSIMRAWAKCIKFSHNSSAKNSGYSIFY
jgi:hypothetical protein